MNLWVLVANMTIESGKLMVLVGASRSGKTKKALQMLKPHKLVLIWDVEGQYENIDYRAKSLGALWQMLRQTAGKRAVIAYTGKLSEFNGFCELAFWWVRANSVAGKKCAVVFEETSDVTNPGKAPEHYGIILRRGLKYGADLLAISQRPAESDKTAIGNASMVHVCRLQLSRDKKYMADMTGLNVKDLEALRADQDLSLFDYITVDTGRGEYQKGRLSFRGDKAIFKTIGVKVSL